MPTPTAHVINKTGKMHRLQAMVDGKIESIHVPPTQGGAKPSRVPAHFVMWQKPHVDHIHIMHFTDKHGNKVAELPADQLPPAFNHPASKPAPEEKAAPAIKPESPAPTLGAAPPTPSAMANVPLRAATPSVNTADAGTNGDTGSTPKTN